MSGSAQAAPNATPVHRAKYPRNVRPTMETTTPTPETLRRLSSVGGELRLATTR